MYLCEQGDFASATSSASTKLIHGGLRYLETFDLRLVRESLSEREVLLRAAAHDNNSTILVVAHDARMIPHVDRVFHLEDGVLVEGAEKPLAMFGSR